MLDFVKEVVLRGYGQNYEVEVDGIFLGTAFYDLGNGTWPCRIPSRPGNDVDLRITTTYADVDDIAAAIRVFVA